MFSVLTGHDGGLFGDDPCPAREFRIDPSKSEGCEGALTF